MKTFECPSCQQTLYFENFQCTRCGQALAYLPELSTFTAVERDGSILAPRRTSGSPAPYLACGNQRDHAACNWAVQEADRQTFCRACRLNVLIPDLSDPRADQSWRELEAAKRRLIYTLLALGLPVASQNEDPEHGLAFAFKAGAEVKTGHEHGLITINAAETHAPFCERMKEELAEPYRTVLGHFRHESGHYYWERLIAGSEHEARFRELFGNPAADYGDAVRRLYADGPRADWRDHFLTSYASMHPWEDWAETWAHYLHMVDTLETARAFSVRLQNKVDRRDSAAKIDTKGVDLGQFEELACAWVPLTLALNSLNRSMGLADPYPFVVPEPAFAKVRFVHEVIAKEAAARV
jgi:hypothetical protein